MKKFSAFLLIFVFSISSLPSLSTIAEEKNNFPKTTLEQALEINENPEKNFDSWEWRRINSILEKQQAGNFSFLQESSNDVLPFDILSGKASMQDAMQLGDFSSGRENAEQILQNIERAIENYKRNSKEKTYPQTLQDFKNYKTQFWAGIRIEGSTEQKNISEIAELFEYERFKNKTEENRAENEDTYGYKIRLKEIPQKTFSISEITPVETKSHNFKELLEKLDDSYKENKIPEIYSLIPSNTFSIYFSSTEKYKQFAKTMENPVAEIANISAIPSIIELEETIGKKLGIPNPRNFLGLIDEFAFVGDDIRIFPSSDFAVIFKCKVDIACQIGGAKKIGNYFVLGTNERIKTRIETLFCPQGSQCKTTTPSIYESKDFKYAWAVTESRRDGFIFFSDDFIRKMVSPEYRINLRRQKSVVEAMNALQYSVWIYKKKEGVFPKNFSDLIEKKYMEEDRVYELEKFSIDSKGIVNHKDWGTPFAITPLSQVDITEVSEREKIWYEEKRDIYASNYQQFFDPIGISISVADKILFHTVILPLSDSKEYQMLRTFTGEKSKENFDLLVDNKNIAAEGVMSFDFDEILYQLGKNEFNREDLNKEESKEICKTKYSENFCDLLFSDISEKEKHILIVEQEITEELDLGFSEGERVFDFIGDEIAIHLGNDMVFDFESFDTSGIDAFISLKLKDSKKGEKFFIEIVKTIGEKINNSNFFGIFINKPIKNYWGEGDNKKAYYSVPTGFVNIFAYFEDDRVSLAISQKTIHNIIEGKISPQANEFQGLNNFLSGGKNVLLRADMNKIVSWIDLFPLEMKAEFSEEIAREIFGYQRAENYSYEAEYFLLKEFLGEEFMKENFSQYPQTMGYKVEFLKDGSFIWKDIKTGEEKLFEDIIESIDFISKAKQFIGAYGTAGLTFAFTAHGAEIKVAFDNIASDGMDNRFIAQSADQNNPIIKVAKAVAQKFDTIEKNPLPFIFGGIGIIIIIIAGFVFLRRK